MEGDRVRQLTTRAVAAALLASALAMAVGLGSLLWRGERASLEAVQVVPPSQMPSQLLAFEPVAWLSLGVLCLLGTPIARVTGLTAWCWVSERRLAAGAGVGVLCFLLGALGRATWLAEQAS